MPGIWHQCALELGDRFCRGATLPGIPGITMGQNNDVAWTFTNVMADVEDLFIERIEGDRYEFQGEWRELELVEEEIDVKGRDEPVRHQVRITHHGPIVNDALGADSSQPLALRWTALDVPGIGRAHFDIFDPTSGEELVALLEALTMPVSNLVWADRHGKIGYKTVGRIPKRPDPGCPDLPKPGWTGEFDWEGAIPYEELPELIDPDAGFLVTANNRIAGDDYPHHISSDYLDGFRAKRIEQLIDATEEHDLDGFRRMQIDLYSIPGDEVAHRLARLDAPGQRETQAIERLKSWDRELGPETIAGTIYQAFLLRLARDFARAAIGDRDLAERWLDRSDSGFTTHVTSPWRWHAHLLALWEQGDEELIGRPWDDLVLEALRGALDDLDPALRPRPGGLALGARARAALLARAGRGQPRLRLGLQPHAARRRRAGDGRPDRLRPQRPLPRDLGAELAHGRRPRWIPAARCGRTSPASPATPGASTTTTCSRAGSPARCSRWPARAPGRR